MSDTKTQTMQQRFGFQDKELTTPKHDEIMLWLDNWVDTNIGKILKLREDSQLSKCKKEWEHPIISTNRSNGGKYTIGFADMKIEYSYAYTEDGNKINGSGYVFFEVKPSIPSLGEVIRQIRMYETYTCYDNYYFGNKDWFVVSPDDKFSKQLESQGIGFIKAEL